MSSPAAATSMCGSVKSGLWKCVQKTPGLNKVIKTEKTFNKVVSISLEIIKPLGITLAGAVFGAVVGVSFGSWPVIVGCTVGGALAGGITYLAIRSVVLVIKKFGYPANKFRSEKRTPLDDYLTDENRKVFNKTVKELKKHPWFQDWLKLRGLENTSNPNKVSKAKRHLWKRIRKGVCHGEVQALLQLMRSQPNASSNKLLKAIQTREVYKKQVLEFMRADFAAALKDEDADEVNGVLRDDLEDNLDILKQMAINIRNAKSYSKAQFTGANLQKPQKFKRHFKEYLDQVKVKAKKKLKHKCFYAGTIRLENAKGSKAHEIFVQISNGRYRFYDPYNQKTGFYEEFADSKEFYKYLHKHLKAYSRVPTLSCTKFKTAELRLYAFKK